MKEQWKNNTIHSTLSYLVQTFRDNDRPNPTRNKDGQLERILSRIYRAWKNEDPPAKQQKALPIYVLREIAKMDLTEKTKSYSPTCNWGLLFCLQIF